MDDTNENQLSENECTRNDMSYLYGRDPSILAYGQRPFPPQEIKKNLISSLEKDEDEHELEHKEKKEAEEENEKKEKDEVEEENGVIINNKTCSVSSSRVQTIKVFLRMKPYPSKMKLTSEQLNAYSILNSTTLLTRMPSLDSNTSCLKKIKANDVISRKFTFTKTFGEDTTQLRLFELAVKSQMIDFLAGKSSVVMSYGKIKFYQSSLSKTKFLISFYRNFLN